MNKHNGVQIRNRHIDKVIYQSKAYDKYCREYPDGRIPEPTGTDPEEDWSLVAIIDLGLTGSRCQRQGCGKAIRFEHIIHHKKAGYRVVGSECINALTQRDRDISEDVLKSYRSVMTAARKIKVWYESACILIEYLGERLLLFPNAAGLCSYSRRGNSYYYEKYCIDYTVNRKLATDTVIEVFIIQQRIGSLWDRISDKHYKSKKSKDLRDKIDKLEKLRDQLRKNSKGEESCTYINKFGEV